MTHKTDARNRRTVTYLPTKHTHVSDRWFHNGWQGRRMFLTADKTNQPYDSNNDPRDWCTQPKSGYTTIDKTRACIERVVSQRRPRHDSRFKSRVKSLTKSGYNFYSPIGPFTHVFIFLLQCAFILCMNVVCCRASKDNTSKEVTGT